MKTIFAAVVLGFTMLAQADDDTPIPRYPEPDEVLASMKRATAFYRSNLSFAGGYATKWSRDLKVSRTEGTESTSVISIQPHGTTTVGLTMLRAHVATGDPLFLQGAKEAADVLAWCQLASGGWGSDFNFELRSAKRYHYRRDLEAGDTEAGKRSARSTLDDNKTQSAIRFLMEFANSPSGGNVPGLRGTLEFAWKGLLTAQAPNGGWPQHFSGPADPSLPVKKASFPAEWSRTFPAVDYTGYYTLNDNNLVHVVDLLLDAHQQAKSDNKRFIEAATRLGDFILQAQLPGPQPVWAQQYDHDMHPAWARKFEPPAACSLESLGAIEILIKVWLATGDEKYIATLPAAFDWFERSKLADEEGTWARLYELETNKPLYLTAETYELTYDDSNLPDHYGFKVKVTTRIGKLKEILAKSRVESVAKEERDARAPRTEEEWSERAKDLASKARSALKTQKKEGYWVDGADIDAGQYVKQMAALTQYLKAASSGGDTFAGVRKKEREKEEAKAKAEKEKAQKEKAEKEKALQEEAKKE